MLRDNLMRNPHQYSIDEDSSSIILKRICILHNMYSWIAKDPAKRAYHSGRALDMELSGYKDSSDIPK